MVQGPGPSIHALLTTSAKPCFTRTKLRVAIINKIEEEKGNCQLLLFSPQSLN